MASMRDLVVGVILLIVSVYAVTQVGLVIGDRFTTSDTLAIDNATNPAGYAAQQNVNQGFYDNLEFTDILVFLSVAVVALLMLNMFGASASA